MLVWHIRSIGTVRGRVYGVLLPILLLACAVIVDESVVAQTSAVALEIPVSSVPPGGILPIHVVVNEATSVDTLVLKLAYDNARLHFLALRPGNSGHKLLAQNTTETGLSLVLFGGDATTPAGRLLTLYLEVDSTAPLSASTTLTDEGSSAANTDAMPVVATLGPASVQVSPLEHRHATDVNGNGRVEISELLRAIQLYNAGQVFCDAASEDGYAVSGENRNCAPHSLDYAPQDWRIGLSELLRCIQIFNALGRAYHAETGGEDTFAPGPVD